MFKDYQNIRQSFQNTRSDYYKQWILKFRLLKVHLSLEIQIFFFLQTKFFRSTDDHDRS